MLTPNQAAIHWVIWNHILEPKPVGLNRTQEFRMKSKRPDQNSLKAKILKICIKRHWIGWKRV